MKACAGETFFLVFPRLRLHEVGIRTNSCNTSTFEYEELLGL